MCFSGELVEDDYLDGLVYNKDGLVDYCGALSADSTINMYKCSDRVKEGGKTRHVLCQYSGSPLPVFR